MNGWDDGFMWGVVMTLLLLGMAAYFWHTEWRQS